MQQTVAAHKIIIFLSLYKCKCLSQPHLSNAAQVNEPLCHLNVNKNLFIANCNRRASAAPDDARDPHHYFGRLFLAADVDIGVDAVDVVAVIKGVEL